MNFEISIEELRKRKLFIATPMYGGQCTGIYTKSCIDLARLCMQYGIDCQFHYIMNESLITRARTYLVDEFMRSGFTHLMFIDSDIDFNPNDVLTLLALDKDIIGGPYPKKCIAWENIDAAVRLGVTKDNPTVLEMFVGDYVFNPVPGTTEIKLDEPADVLEIGTGFMMIRRDVFTRFQEAHPERMYKPDHNRTANFDGSREICLFFDCYIDPGTKRYLSEDYAFCQECREMGIHVYLCPWMKLKHMGSYTFGGSLTDIAQLQMAKVNANQALNQAGRALKNAVATALGVVPATRQVRRAATRELEKLGWDVSSPETIRARALSEKLITEDGAVNDAPVPAQSVIPPVEVDITTVQDAATIPDATPAIDGAAGVQ